MFFAFAYKGGSLRASFDGLGEVVKTSRGTVLESAWVFWMRLSIIWRIMEIDEVVIRRGRLGRDG